MKKTENIIMFLSKIFDLLVLNFLFIIMCLPVVTIGANVTAVYFVTLKMCRGEGYYVLKDYFRSFKDNFKQATIISTILFGWLLAVGVEVNVYVTWVS